MWLLMPLWLALCGVVAAVRCPDGRLCWGLDVCCLEPGQDGYTCCPLSLASPHSLPMTPASSMADPAGTVCPDGTRCPVEHSCLRTSAGSFSCCPLSKAVSCADGHHCCPWGAHCSINGKVCFRLPGLPTIGAVQCPDGKSQCPDESTCCMMPNGSWGCCPMPQASCCADRIHCCPRATTCDLAHSRCLSPSGEQPMGRKVPAQKRAPWLGVPVSPAKITCPDKSVCPDGTTCCLLPSSQYGCCPLQNGYRCNPALGTCQEPGVSIPWLEKTPARVRATSWGQEVQCDEQTSCPDDDTCCRLATGAWGCCPLAEAVCCQDHIHCCPKGYTCNPASGTCQASSASIPWLMKTPAQVTVTSKGKDVQCDQQTSCPDGSTCCRLATGAWSCCPLVEAVCCQDHIHCCPKGCTCDLASGTCQAHSTSIPWLEKTPARVRATSWGQEVQCDEQTSCPDDDTCCRLATGAWGCCPLAEAVCCQDHIHCCPKGYTCNPASGACQASSASIPWLMKTPAQVTVTSKGKDVQCDQQTSCPDGSTCCRLATGAWSCCPFVEAVCCQDHIHCCPKGYTCDLERGACQQNLLSMPWLPKTPALMASAPQSQVVKCDETSSCEDGQTCCKSVTGTWACCHLPNAVCCEDHQHCCPSGYTCNLAAQTCEKQQTLPEAKSPSTALLPASLEPSNEVPCDAQHFCHDRQTCCKASSGAWACCPYNQGICCSDGLHCCPHHFRCSKSSLTCKWKWFPPSDTGAFIPPAPQPQPLL